MNFEFITRNKVLIVLILLVLFASCAVEAAKSYGVGARCSTGIYTVDYDTASVSLLFPTSEISWYGATDGDRDHPNTFYATPTGGSLYLIDVVSKTATAVGSYSNATITGLAYDEVHGVMYGTDYVSLYTIDITKGSPTLGTETLIGSLGWTSYAWALDYDESINELVGISQTPQGSKIYHIDRETGSAIPVPDAPILPPRITDIWYDDQSGSMYGVSNDAFQIGIGKIYRINTTTGQTEFIGAFSEDLLGLGAPPHSPEPATIVLLGLGAAFLKRNRR